MPRFDKWLTTVRADSPADSVAREALAQRLAAVMHFLDRSQGGGNAERIHQLRVWTRRAAAAIKLFEPGLPGKRSRRVKKLLRKIRLSAGDVRDCDVHLERLQTEHRELPRRLFRDLDQRRRSARRHFKALRRRLRSSGRLEKLARRLVAKIGWPKRHSSRGAPPFGDFCRRQLQPLAGEFFQLAGGNLRNDKELHALRIAGKRFRYALELAPAAIPRRKHRLLTAELKECQDRLGEICDSLASIELLRDELDHAQRKRDRQRLEALLADERARLNELRSKFRRSWHALSRRLMQLWQEVA